MNISQAKKLIKSMGIPNSVIDSAFDVGSGLMGMLPGVSKEEITDIADAIKSDEKPKGDNHYAKAPYKPPTNRKYPKL